MEKTIYVLVVQPKGRSKKKKTTLFQVEWSESLEILEACFNEVHGDNFEIIEVMRVVKTYQEKRSPFPTKGVECLEWCMM